MMKSLKLRKIMQIVDNFLYRMIAFVSHNFENLYIFPREHYCDSLVVEVGIWVPG